MFIQDYAVDNRLQLYNAYKSYYTFVILPLNKLQYTSHSKNKDGVRCILSL